MSIRTVLVDDEPLATQGLQLRLQAFDDVDIVATAANGREAIRQIKTHKPDLVFLDIQMPGFDGFSVIQGLMDVERWTLSRHCSCSSPLLTSMRCARSTPRRWIT